MNAQPFRIGIIGGMGPLAGVELHRLIIEATPAAKDQDHLQVLLYTNPHIPDRTRSLQEDGGERFATQAGASAQLLEQAGAQLITIACMTAHSRLATIRKHVSVPVVNGIRLVHTAIRNNPLDQPVALVATKGSIASGVYTTSSPDISWLLPDPGLQDRIQSAIYDHIKAGNTMTGLAVMHDVMRKLQTQGAKSFVLGCTELGLLYDALQQYGYHLVEPLRLLASHVVDISQKAKSVDTPTMIRYTAK